MPRKTPREAPRRAAHHGVWDQREQGGDDQRLEGANGMNDRDLVNEVERQRDEEELPYPAPAASNCLSSVARVSDDAPQERRPTCPCVVHAVS
jgi:hypothetical protein